MLQSLLVKSTSPTASKLSTLAGRFDAFSGGLEAAPSPPALGWPDVPPLPADAPPRPLAAPDRPAVSALARPALCSRPPAPASSAAPLMAADPAAALLPPLPAAAMSMTVDLRS